MTIQLFFAKYRLWLWVFPTDFGMLQCEATNLFSQLSPRSPLLFRFPAPCCASSLSLYLHNHFSLYVVLWHPYLCGSCSLILDWESTVAGVLGWAFIFFDWNFLLGLRKTLTLQWSGLGGYGSFWDFPGLSKSSSGRMGFLITGSPGDVNIKHAWGSDWSC